ncbi:hypothetical protein [Mangrovicoccus algicola]|uniref:Fibronectin type III domain-containing protein n=1 Tax=Mangrovicoccus algicola TaxID=2771008 RepID=A0A8J6YYC5_9RHOB|nr:hypothetical protein [Mangrovicoccus algicola]MBE3638018.1 hypothetical protein [Mangrovicoccus algicola]
MTRILLSAVLALAAGAASADQITLDRPMSGAALHEGGTDMTVYWTEVAGGYEVIATYKGAADAAASRIAMVLKEGERVSFGLPGSRGLTYSFARENGAVTVSGARIGVDLAEG